MTGEVDPSRRGFLKAMVGLSAVAAVGGLGKGVVQNLITPAVGLTNFPETLLYWNDPSTPNSAPVPLKASQFEVESPSVWIYYYPLSDEPNFVIRFDREVPPTSVTIDATGEVYTFTGGVGPDNSIVSYSAICQHLGCIPPIIHYYPPGHELDKDKMIEELGDVLWYIFEGARVLGIDASEIAERNVIKLSKRYPDGFDPERSKNRNDDGN